jgi:uncharacterized membrane protein YoaK (UPF0700 family)
VPFPPLAVVLGAAAGAVDAACFTRLGHVFGGVMTGNLTLLGLAAAQLSGSLAGYVAVALLGYLTGTALGTAVARWAGRAGVPRPAPVTAVLLIEAAALAGFTIGWVLTGGHPAGAAQLGLLAVGALAMGLQGGAVRAVGTTLSTTYLTGTLTTTVAGLVTGGGSRSGTRWNVAVLVAHAAGAAGAGGLLFVAPAALPVLPDAALLGVLAVVMTGGVRSQAGPAPSHGGSGE